LAVGGLGLAAIVVAAETVNRLAGRSVASPPSGSGTRVGVVVLGYPSRRDGSPNSVQRRRVNTGVRVMRRHDAATMVMSGGPVRNEHAEADTMVALASSLGIDPTALVAENRSRTTWENVEESASFVEDCDLVLIASEPLHAARARRYWIKQRPTDARRVFVAVDRRRWFEQWWLTTPAVVYELKLAIQDRVSFNDLGADEIS
jgi:uncharacterized SAM-binding protein YcdF (DUF218 family)